MYTGDAWLIGDLDEEWVTLTSLSSPGLYMSGQKLTMKTYDDVAVDEGRRIELRVEAELAQRPEVAKVIQKSRTADVVGLGLKAYM